MKHLAYVTKALPVIPVRSPSAPRVVLVKDIVSPLNSASAIVVGLVAAVRCLLVRITIIAPVMPLLVNNVIVQITVL